MNETEVNIDTNGSREDVNDLENDTSNTLVINIDQPKDGNEERDKSTPEERKHLVTDNDIKSAVNPLYYEVGFFPRKQQSTWVQIMGVPPIPTDGEPLQYDSSRNDFVRLVFTIVFVMLLLTAGLTLLANVVVPINNIFTSHGMIMLIIGSIITLVVSYAMSCSPCTRVAPWNFIVLLLAVFGFSIICAYFTIKYSIAAVYLSLISTSVVVLVCLGLACTSFDFTRFLLYVIVAGLALAVISLVSFLYMLITKEHIKWLHLAILAVSTIIHAVTLIMELQMILGGKTVEISENDYPLAAYMVYSSIISIFINLLQILGILDDG